MLRTFVSILKKNELRRHCARIGSTYKDIPPLCSSADTLSLRKLQSELEKD